MDIVDDFLTRLAKHVPDLPIETRLKLEQETRKHWGGNRAEVAKGIGGLSRTTRRWVVAHGLSQAQPMGDIFRMANVSRRTGYRILGSK